MYTWARSGHSHDIPARIWVCSGDDAHQWWSLGEVERVEREGLRRLIVAGVWSPVAFTSICQCLGLSGKRAALLLGVRPETVSRWSTGAREIDPRAFAMIATLFLEELYGEPRALEVLSAMRRPYDDGSMAMWKLRGRGIRRWLT
jgi:hypothetical protein